MVVQWARLSSKSSHSRTSSTGTCSVAGSCIWSDVKSGSSSGAILSTVAPLGDGSSVAAGSGSPSVVGSGCCSAQQGGDGLGSGLTCIMDQGRTLSRHRMMASLQFSPVVSGRSTGVVAVCPELEQGLQCLVIEGGIDGETAEVPCKILHILAPPGESHGEIYTKKIQNKNFLNKKQTCGKHTVSTSFFLVRYSVTKRCLSTFTTKKIIVKQSLMNPHRG